MNYHQLDECPQSILHIRKLIGLRVEGGWSKEIEEHLGRIKGCTCTRELLFNMAKAAFQSIATEIPLNLAQDMPFINFSFLEFSISHPKRYFR